MDNTLKIRKSNISHYIEHTNVHPAATKKDIEKLCDEAVQYHFYAVCVSPIYVALAKKILSKVHPARRIGSSFKSLPNYSLLKPSSSLLREDSSGGVNIFVVCVVGFPHGSSYTESKVVETKAAVYNGADEIDMTMNIGAFKNKNYDYVYDDINAVVIAAQGRNVKVIIETGYLVKDEIKKAARIAKKAGAHFIKTCTGYGPRGVIINDVRLLYHLLKRSVGIKASGGIKSYDKAISLILAGASRIGTSHSVGIMQTLKSIKT